MNKINVLMLLSVIAIFSFIFSQANTNQNDSNGVSIIIATMRQEYMDIVFKNYSKQTYPKKELIVILNDDSMDINQ